MGRAMKDSGVEWIGEIPEDWTITKIKNGTSKVGSGKTPSGGAEVYTNSGVLFLRSQNIYNSGLDISSPTYIAETVDEEMSSTRVMCGDVLLNITGASIGRCCIFPEGIPQANVNQHVSIIRTTGTLFSKEYLHYFWISDLGQRAISLYQTGGNREGMSAESIKNTPIPIPTLQKQARIVNILDGKCKKIDAVINKTHSSIEEYKHLKQAVITQAVTKGVRRDRPMKESGIEWIGKIPSEWNINKVVRIFSLIGSGTTPSTTDEAVFNGDVNWIQSGDINGAVLSECKNQISKTTLEKYSVLRIYDAPYIVLAMYGASIGNLSISTIDACVNQACCVLCNPYIDLQFAFYSLKSAKDYLIQKAQGGGRPNISQNIVKQLWLPVPSLDEQREIAAYLDEKCAEIDALIAKKEQLLTELENYKKALIYEYVTGKKEAAP